MRPCSWRQPNRLRGWKGGRRFNNRRKLRFQVKEELSGCAAVIDKFDELKRIVR